MLLESVSTFEGICIDIAVGVDVDESVAEREEVDQFGRSPLNAQAMLLGAWHNRVK